MRTQIAALLLGFSLSSPQFARGDQPLAGTLKTVKGGVTIGRGGKSLPGREGLHIFSQDSIRTGADGSAGIILHDGTRISLGPSSEIAIERFAFEPAQRQLSLVLRMVQGVAAYISGKISQLAPGSVEVATPAGIIGLRGTEFVLSVERP